MRLGSLVTSGEQAIELVVRRLGDAKDQEPAIALEIGDPFQAVESEVEGVDCSGADVGAKRVEKEGSVVSFYLKGAGEGDVEGERDAEVGLQTWFEVWDGELGAPFGVVAVE